MTGAGSITMEKAPAQRGWFVVCVWWCVCVEEVFKAAIGLQFELDDEVEYDRLTIQG